MKVHTRSIHISGTSQASESSRYGERISPIALRLRSVGLPTIVAALLCSFLLSYGIITLFAVRYLVVDDPLLAIIAGNGYGNSNSPYLIFINIIIGWLFQFLYALVPSVPWYPLILVGLEWLAFSYAYILIRRFTNKLSPLVVMATVQITASLSFTYTTVGTVLASVGILGIALSAFSGSRWNCFLVPCSLVWLGFLIRVPAFMVAFIVGFPLLVFAWTVSSAGMRKTLAVILLVVIAAFGTAEAVNTAAYSSNIHNQNALTRQDDAHRMVDYRPVDFSENQEQFASMGWSQNDLDSYYAWVIADFKTYSVRNLAKLGEMNTFHNKYELSPVVLAKSMASRWNAIALCSILALAGVGRRYTNRIVNQRQRTAFRWLCVFTVLLSGAELLLLYVRQRAVVNAMDSLLLGTAIVLIGILTMVLAPRDNQIQRYQKAEIRERVSWLISRISTVLLIVVACISMLFCANTNDTMDSTDYSELDDSLTSWMNRHPAVLVVTGAGMRYRQQGPIFSLRTPEHFQQMVKIGSWSIDGQRWYDQLSKWDVDPEHLVLQIAQKDNLVFIPDNPQQLNLVTAFIEEHTGKRVDTKQISTLDGMAVIYELSLADG